jgi:uncharacterized membrane protein (DUF485 family)
MPGFDHVHHAPSEPDDARNVARNARYGLWLFALYFAIYSTFVGLNAFSPETMATTIAGVNLAVAYGMGLIVAALVLALVYCWLCRERPTDHRETASEVGR